MIFNHTIRPFYVPDHDRGIKQIVSNQLHKAVFFGFGPKGSKKEPDWFGTDVEQNQTTLQQLQDIGAEDFMLPTPEGDKIHAIYLDASEFEGKMSEVVKIQGNEISVVEPDQDSSSETQQFTKAG